MHVCAANNSLECANILLPRVKNLNVTDKTGATSLHHAAFNQKHCDMVSFLLKNGCDANSIDKNGCRPLHYAAASDNNDAIGILLMYGAKIQAQVS